MNKRLEEIKRMYRRATAREDIPFLLAEIGRLQDELKYASDGAKVLAREGERLAAERDAEVRDLRDNAFRSCRVCSHYQKNRRCDLEETQGYKDCAGFNRWEWRGVIDDAIPPMLDAAYDYRGAEPPKEDA